jgi:hypothetical protein
MQFILEELLPLRLRRRTLEALNRGALLSWISQDSVFEAPAFSLDPLHQAAGPDKFGGQQTEPEKNNQHSRPGSNQHNAPCQEQGESSDDKEDAADLLDRAKDHGPLRNQLSGGEGGILTLAYSDCQPLSAISK